MGCVSQPCQVAFPHRRRVPTIPTDPDRFCGSSGDSIRPLRSRPLRGASAKRRPRGHDGSEDRRHCDRARSDAAHAEPTRLYAGSWAQGRGLEFIDHAAASRTRRLPNNGKGSRSPKPSSCGAGCECGDSLHELKATLMRFRRCRQRCSGSRRRISAPFVLTASADTPLRTSTPRADPEIP